MKLPDELNDECLLKIRKVMNHYGYQNRDMADDIIAEIAKPIFEYGKEACQIAENAMMREALILAQNNIDWGDFKGQISIIDLHNTINKALSTTPRLVEVGEVDDTGIGYLTVGVDNVGDYPIGTKLYTIQKAPTA